MKFESDTNQPLPPDYPRTSRPAADFRLVDQSGASVSPKSFRGKTVFLTFAFAHCATVCPVLVTQSLQALNQLDPERTSLVIVTLDPWRDTPRSLPFLAEKWKLPKNAHVLSGDVVDVNAVISEYGIPTSRDEKNGDVSHPAIVYVLDGRGRIAYTFNNPSPGWLLEAERRVRDGYARR